MCVYYTNSPVDIGKGSAACSFPFPIRPFLLSPRRSTWPSHAGKSGPGWAWERQIRNWRRHDMGGMLSRREDMLMKRLTVLLEVFPSCTSLRSAAAVREQLLAQHSTVHQGNWHNRGCYRTQTYGRELRLRAGDSCTPRWLQSTSSPVLRTASR